MYKRQDRFAYGTRLARGVGIRGAETVDADLGQPIALTEDDSLAVAPRLHKLRRAGSAAVDEEMDVTEIGSRKFGALQP